MSSPEFRYWDENMPIKLCSEAYFFRLEVLQRAWNLRLGTPSLKSLPEDLCSGVLYPEKIHRPQPELNLGSPGEHVTPRRTANWDRFSEWGRESRSNCSVKFHSLTRTSPHILRKRATRCKKTEFLNRSAI